MARPKLTPWFPGDVRPARPGVYQRLMPHGKAWAAWTGKHWLTSWSTREGAMRAAPRSKYQPDPLGPRWRGRATPG